MEYLTTSLCSIPRRRILTIDEFEDNFFLQQPVLLDSNHHHNAAELSWSLILKKFGDLKVRIGSSSSLADSGIASQTMTIRQYAEYIHDAGPLLNGSKLFVFDRDGILLDAPELSKGYQVHPIFSQHSATRTLSLGTSGTGIHFHFHLDAWLELLAGYKRWFLYPPSVGNQPGRGATQSSLEWVLDALPSLSVDQRPLQCVQGPGQIMYVPEGWYHAVVNIGDTVAIAGQARRPSVGSLEHHIYSMKQLGGAGQLSHAATSYRHALKLSMDNSVLHEVMGALYLASGHWHAAYGCYRKAMRAHPFSAKAALAAGMVQEQLGNQGAALRLLKKACSLPHSSPGQKANSCAEYNRVLGKRTWAKEGSSRVMSH